jgi:hypothetical protein
VDRICWQAGDEFKCKKCSGWHATFIADPDELRYATNQVLNFNCPRFPNGYLYAGRAGEPVFDLDRWRRPPV